MLGYDFTFQLLAIGGHNTWSNLVRLETGSDVFVMDLAADITENLKTTASLEALIRRLWSAKPSTRIILMSSPNWSTVDIEVDENVHHPVNEDYLNLTLAFAAHYGIPVVPYWAWCKTVVDAGTYHLNELTEDTVHPTDLGYTAMADLLKPYMPRGGQAQPSPLPARYFDSESYENTPTRTDGTDYDSRTGTGWTDDGTATYSTTAGDTITYSATCQSIGVYRTDAGTNANLEISVDSGAYRDESLSVYGIALDEGFGAHTITIRLKAGGDLRVDEFWAV